MMSPPGLTLATSTRSLLYFRSYSLSAWLNNSICWQCRQLASSLTTKSRRRLLHVSSVCRARPLPGTGTGLGPPPDPPAPRQFIDTPPFSSSRLRDATVPKPRVQRFWSDVHIERQDGRYQVLLDRRPIRTPSRHIISVPLTKRILAHALQVEWALMRTSSEALKPHLIPVTSLVARAVDLEETEKSGLLEQNISEGNTSKLLKGTRREIVDFLMSYLDTDTLLMISPTRGGHMAGQGEKQLRDLQLQVAHDAIDWVKENIPALEDGEELVLHISDGDHGLLPLEQPKETGEALKKYITKLSTWDLVGLERAVIIGKSLIAGLRLVVENGKGGKGNWGIEDAARACNLELDWQIEQWGLVEDTHDVNHVDIRRGFGSVVLLISDSEESGESN